MTIATSAENSAHGPGTLFLVPAPLDFGCAELVPLTQVLPQHTLDVAARLTHWVCENARSTRAYLKRVDALVPLAQPLQALQIQELPRSVHKAGDHVKPAEKAARRPAAPPFDARALLAPALRENGGHDIGLVSEAGMPAIADPGSGVVRAAHDLGLPVVALAGPVSLLLALAASGLNGQNFAFVGYLPQDAAERTRRIRELEALALRSGQTQLCIETPYRNPALLQALVHTLQPGTRLSVSLGLSLPTARTLSRSVAHWRQQPQELPRDVPAVFGFGV